MNSIRWVVVLILLAGSAEAGRPMRGFYSVPVQEPELKPHAEYPVKFKADSYEADPTQLEFPLPVELVGQPVTIQMQTVDPAAGAFAGAGATGNCQKLGRTLECRIEFTGLPFDAAAAEAAIDARFAPGEARLRKQVSAQFRSEPIGILSYRLRGRDRD